MSASSPVRVAPVEEALRRVRQALDAQTYFKLICGASFQDLSKIEALVEVYAYAGADCIDIACEPPVLEAALRAYEKLPENISKPLLMVSLDVDGDPHFRKVQVTRSRCVDCGDCLSSCPVEALSFDTSQQFQINDARCYGCSRCLPTCPTEALSFKALQYLPEQLLEVLAHPMVGAVELHTHHLDGSALGRLVKALGVTLHNKWISLCFRPQEHPPEAVDLYLKAFADHCAEIKPYGVMLQIDGQAMQASEAKESSLPALDATRTLPASFATRWKLTVSGGINLETARLRRLPPYRTIAGVGLGTLARKRIWSYLDQLEDPVVFQHAIGVAQEMVQAFH